MIIGKKLNNACDLCSYMVCTTFLPEWQPANVAYRQTFQYKKGTTAFYGWQRSVRDVFLQAGNVKVYKRWSDHKALIVRFAKKGNMIGHQG